MTALSRSLSCWVASLAFHGAVGPVSVPVGELDFVLAEVVDELAAVMDVGGRRRPANVRLLDLQPPPLAPRPFGDAIAA